MVNASNRRDLIVKVVLDSLVRNMEIPDGIYRDAYNIYKRASEAGLVRGRSIEVVVAASLYAAIRMHSAPQTLEDIARSAEPRKKSIGRMYRLLVKELDLKTIPINSEDTMRRLCEDLKLKESTKQEAIDIMKRAEEQGLMSGRNPMSVVAAVIYHASLGHDERITQRSISIVTGVTEATIRNRTRELEERLGLPKKPRHPADLRAERKRKMREAALREQQQMENI